MMRVRSLAAVVLYASAQRGALGAALPSKGQVNTIEIALRDQPCVGNLDGWERRYRFTRKRTPNFRDGRVDEGTVEFRLRRAGSYNIRTGRMILPPMRVNVLEIDDTPVKMAWGTYAVKTQHLTIDFCGQN